MQNFMRNFRHQSTITDIIENFLAKYRLCSSEYLSVSTFFLTNHLFNMFLAGERNSFYMQRQGSLCPHVWWNVGVHYVKQSEGSCNMVELVGQKKKYFMFKAFVSIDGPSSNLAEVVHAGWKNSHAINLSLLRCSHKDIKCRLYIKQWMKDLTAGQCNTWI